MPKKKMHLNRPRLLASVPHLNPAVRWQKLDSGEAMAVYQREARGFRRILVKLFALPESGQLMLDDAGTKVIDAVDGRKTVAELVEYIQVEFNLSREDSEKSLLNYMELLGRRRLIGFEVPERRAEA
jgi:coenzyme PQQ synthesis protein D (PqqD)